MKSVLIVLLSVMLPLHAYASGERHEGKHRNRGYPFQYLQMQIDLLNEKLNGLQSGNNSLLSLVSEPAGVNCSNGGMRLNTGVDSNGNGVLDESEITSFDYICNGIDGGSVQTADVTPPTISHQAPQVSSSPTETVVFDLADDIELASFTLAKVNMAGSVIPIQTGVNAISLSQMLILDDGENNFIALATDTAGNSSKSEFLILKIGAFSFIIPDTVANDILNAIQPFAGIPYMAGDYSLNVAGASFNLNSQQVIFTADSVTIDQVANDFIQVTVSFPSITVSANADITFSGINGAGPIEATATDSTVTMAIELLDAVTNTKPTINSTQLKLGQVISSSPNLGPVTYNLNLDNPTIEQLFLLNATLMEDLMANQLAENIMGPMFNSILPNVPSFSAQVSY